VVLSQNNSLSEGFTFPLNRSF